MSWTHPALESIANLVGQRMGLSLSNRTEWVEQGIRRAMKRARMDDFAPYQELIARDDNALDDLMNDLTVGETYFFREAGQFRFLKAVVLPEIRERRGPLHTLRAWSAACASGEEAYSLAILLEQEGFAERTHLAATDISKNLLARARQASYEDWSFRGEMAKAALPYLTRTGKRYELDERIRRRVTFTYLNLAQDAYPALANGIWGMDLILCRNVLIYMDQANVRRVACRLYETLAEGGWLITASSDPFFWELAPFEVVTTDEGVFYRRPSSSSSRLPIADCRLQIEMQSAIDPGQNVLPAEASPVVGSVEQGGLHTTAVPELGDAAAEARQALARGAYRRVVELTHHSLHHVEAAILHVRALANLETADAERICTQAIAIHPFSAELHYLQAVLQLALGRIDEAMQAIRRVLYLDRSLAIVHFTLGSILRDRGDRTEAARAFRNARDLCGARPATEEIPLADGETAGRLAAIAGRELALLDASGGK